MKKIEANFSSKENYTLSPTEIELLDELEAVEEPPYPWDTTDPASEAYFAEQEQEFLLSNFLSEEEINIRSQNFFNQLDQIWATNAPVASTDIEVTLQQQFAQSVPQGWLNAIAQTAKLVSTTQKSTADKLIQCIQEVLPNWSKEDLVVLVRPYAYAMRGKEIEKIESVVNNLRSQDWQMLSEIEQARVAIAITHYTLTQLSNHQEHEE